MKLDYFSRSFYKLTLLTWPNFYLILRYIKLCNSFVMTMTVAAVEKCLPIFLSYFEFRNHLLHNNINIDHVIINSCYEFGERVNCIT